MTEIEKAQLKMACINEASRLKQNPNSAKEYEGKSVVDIAIELEAFVFGA